MLKGHGADLQSPVAQWVPEKWNHEDGLIMRCMVTSGRVVIPIVVVGFFGCLCSSSRYSLEGEGVEL